MMKRIIFGVLVWLLSAQLALAAISKTQTSVQNVVNQATTTVTFTAVPIGTATSDRYVFVAVTCTDLASTSSVDTGITIGGSAATRDISAISNVTMSNTIYHLKVTSGTTANIVVTLAGTPAQTDVLISVYSITGADQTTPISASNASGTGGTSPSTTLTVPASGLFFGVSSGISTSTTPTVAWTNATTDANQHPNDGLATTTQETAFTTSTGSLTVTATWTNGQVGSIFPNQVAVAIAAAAAGGAVTPLRARRGYGN